MKISKRIVVSGMLGIVGFAVAGIAYAAFTANATLAQNTMSTGDVNLHIGNLSSATGSCSSFGESVSGINTSGILPGETDSKYFCLRNISDTDDIVFDLTADASVSGPEDDTLLDKNLVSLIVQCSDPGENLDETTAPSIPVTLDDENTSGVIASVPKGTTVTVSTVKCKISQTLSSTADNSAKGKTIQYDLLFTGTQDTADTLED